ncbi:hypothetical protein [uncultured Clostridium sp.]|nr:hypothetical protein [uncultured Clostridium sp.]
MVLLVVDTQKLITKEIYKYHNEFIWNGRYAECISLDKTIRIMK